MQKRSLARQISMRITIAQLVLPVLAVLLVSAIPAAAQPDWRFFAGFSDLRFESGTGHENAAGWGGAITQYISTARWFGATAEVSGVYKTYAPDIHTSFYGVMLGPSFAYRKNPNIEPFVHALFGWAGNTSNTGAKSVWVFGYALGGGADFKISKLLAVRGQADFVRTSFPDGYNDRQNNIRVLGGLVLRFAK
ncbi:MAG TPA: hypothetical protein VMG30_12095 [Acidobacteriota bacterium]|nr:hypothetical protein [Acidobacteriota bacterium]